MRSMPPMAGAAGLQRGDRQGGELQRVGPARGAVLQGGLEEGRLHRGQPRDRISGGGRP